MLVLTSRARGSVSSSHRSQSSKRNFRNLDLTHHQDQDSHRDQDHPRDRPISKPCNIEPLGVTPKFQHRLIEARAMPVSPTNQEALYPLRKKYVTTAITQGI